MNNFIPLSNPYRLFYSTECPCCCSDDTEMDDEVPIWICCFCGYVWDYSIPISVEDISLYGHYYCGFSLVSGDQPSLLIE